MKIIAKLGIFLVAVILTFAMFNAISFRSAVDILKIGRYAGNEIISNVLAGSDAATVLASHGRS